MSRLQKDPRQGNATDLGKWLADTKNREKMYRHDREAAEYFAKMKEAPECTTKAPDSPQGKTANA